MKLFATLAGIWHLIWNPNVFNEEILGKERDASQLQSSAISEFNRTVEGVLATRRLENTMRRLSRNE